MAEGPLRQRCDRSIPLIDSRGSSAVIGTILLLAVVLVLAGSTLLLGQSVAPDLSETNQASFTFAYSPDGNQDTLTITHDGGDRLAGDRTDIIVEGASPPGVDGTYGWTDASLDGEQTVQSGDAVTLAPGTIGDASRLDLDSATVRVRIHSSKSDRSLILARWSGPDHGESDPRSLTSAESVTSIDESETIGGDKKFYFHIEAVQEVTIVEFALTTASEGDMEDVETLGGSGNDVVIESSGGYTEGSADEGGSGFSTDGTAYALDTNGTIPADGMANVSLSEFHTEDGSTYTFTAGDPEFTTQSGPWDFSITFRFRDGTDLTFYVDVPS